MQAKQALQIPVETPLDFAHTCATYLRFEFQFKLNSFNLWLIGGVSTAPTPPLLLPVALVLELDRIALTLMNAFHNRVKVQWDAARYAERAPKNTVNLQKSGTKGGKNSGTKASKLKEASMKRLYPPLNEVIVSEPCIIVDMHGIIMAWYLPGILKDSRQEHLFTLSDHCSKNDNPSERHDSSNDKFVSIAGKVAIQQILKLAHRSGTFLERWQDALGGDQYVAGMVSKGA
ncbi:hypothetical protein BJV77DRAFT_966873 [Russula vinacea]|nr:hypothetical protein BJV77DRAFT_966873 [Russula vinacea]